MYSFQLISLTVGVNVSSDYWRCTAIRPKFGSRSYLLLPFTLAMSEPNFEEVLAFAIETARSAGKMIRESSTKRATTNQASTSADATKKNRVDRE